MGASSPTARPPRNNSVEEAAVHEAARTDEVAQHEAAEESTDDNIVAAEESAQLVAAMTDEGAVPDGHAVLLHAGPGVPGDVYFTLLKIGASRFTFTLLYLKLALANLLLLYFT